MTEHERENELAELLREVRALRQELGQLKGGQPEALRDPNYAVLVRAESARDPNYAVLVRQLTTQDESIRSGIQLREPSYEVLVRQDLQREDPEIAQ